MPEHKSKKLEPEEEALERQKELTAEGARQVVSLITEAEARKATIAALEAELRKAADQSSAETARRETLEARLAQAHKNFSSTHAQLIETERAGVKLEAEVERLKDERGKLVEFLNGEEMEFIHRGLDSATQDLFIIKQDEGGVLVEGHDEDCECCKCRAKECFSRLDFLLGDANKLLASLGKREGGK